MAYRGPAGLPGKPENTEGFVLCRADEGIVFYIANDIWESLAPTDKELIISVEGYGRFVLDLNPDGGSEPTNDASSSGGVKCR